MPSNKLVSAEQRAARLALFLFLSLPAVARAEAKTGVAPAPIDAPPRGTELARTARGTDGYQHWLGGVTFGRGLRLNNPYRLRTVLGDDAESPSLSASFVDVHAARLFGSPRGFEHGVALHFSIATDGVRQEVLSPSYIVARRFGPRLLAWARAGLPIVLEPDASLGGEVGLASAYMLSAAIGIESELDFSLFYGAATPGRSYSTIPVLALSLGVFFDFEVLP